MSTSKTAVRKDNRGVVIPSIEPYVIDLAKAEELFQISGSQATGPGVRRWNRSLRDATVEKYTRLMAGDKWRQYAPQPLVILEGPDHDRLVDGQRRIAAQIRHGRKNPDFSMGYFVYRTKDETLASAAIDKGDPRRANDEIAMMQIERPIVVAGALRMLYAMRRNPLFVEGNDGSGWFPDDPKGSDRPKRPDPAWVELRMILEEDEDFMVESFNAGYDYSYKFPLKQLPRSVVTAMHYRLSKLDKIGAEVFWSQVTSPQTAEVGGGPRLLHDYLEGLYLERKRLTGTAGIRKAIFCVSLAWDMWKNPEQHKTRRGTKRTTLITRDSWSMPYLAG